MEVYVKERCIIESVDVKVTRHIVLGSHFAISPSYGLAGLDDAHIIVKDLKHIEDMNEDDLGQWGNGLDELGDIWVCFQYIGSDELTKRGIHWLPLVEFATVISGL